MKEGIVEELLVKYEQVFILQGESFRLTVPLSGLDNLERIVTKRLNDPHRGVNEAIKVRGNRGSTLVVPAPDALRLLEAIGQIREIAWQS
jgi:hypothetical protein